MTKATAYLALALMAACSGDAGGADANVADADPNQPDAGSMFAQPPGQFFVTADVANSMMYLSGSFSDGPPIEPRQEMSRIGSCRLMQYTPTFCDPACNVPLETCVEGVCEPTPMRLDRGSIDWAWPGGQTSVTPDGTNYYAATGGAASHGETRLTVDGETLALTTSPAPLADGDWMQIIASRSGDAVLRWNNPITSARVRLYMTDCAGSHGGIGESEIECDATDTGQLTIPDAFLTALEAGDWSHGECGSHSVIRYAHRDSADGTFRFEARGVASLFYFPGQN